MKIVIGIVGAVLAATVGLYAAEHCTFDGERFSGSSKICYYYCPSGNVAVTVAASENCSHSYEK